MAGLCGASMQRRQLSRVKKWRTVHNNATIPVVTSSLTKNIWFKSILHFCYCLQCLHIYESFVKKNVCIMAEIHRFCKWWPWPISSRSDDQTFVVRCVLVLVAGWNVWDETCEIAGSPKYLRQIIMKENIIILKLRL